MNAFRHPQINNDLEFRLRKIHQRKRRGFIQQVVTTACWSLGLLAMAAFVAALAVSAVSK